MTLIVTIEPQEFMSLAIQRGLKVYEAYEISGISISCWKRWLNGKRKTKASLENKSKLAQIAIALGWLDDPLKMYHRETGF